MLEQLQKLGLSEKESTTYYNLTKQGETTANTLAKATATNRTVTYNILQQLIEKGLVTYIKKKKKRHYRIADPKALLAPVKEQELIAKDLVKEINNIKTKQVSTRNVEVYEGIEGLRINFEAIRQAKELRVLNATGLVFEYLNYSAKHIVKEIDIKSKPKVIAVQSMKKTQLVKFKHQQLKYLPKEAENYATTFIFEGKVIIVTLKDTPFIIKIENKEIYEGYKKDFDVFWKKL